jgi:hypothetical protein
MLTLSSIAFATSNGELGGLTLAANCSLRTAPVRGLDKMKEAMGSNRRSRKISHNGSSFSYTVPLIHVEIEEDRGV